MDKVVFNDIVKVYNPNYKNELTNDKLMFYKEKLSRYSYVRSFLNGIGNFFGLGYLGYRDISGSLCEDIKDIPNCMIYNFMYNYRRTLVSLNYNDNDIKKKVEDSCVLILDTIY